MITYLKSAKQIKICLAFFFNNLCYNKVENYKKIREEEIKIMNLNRNEKHSFEIAIIGGGASGFITAITAKRRGKSVVILEKKDRVLKKVLTTGNGRCNYTNVTANIKNYYGQNIEKVEHILNSFTPDDTIKFFQEIGIEPKFRDKGKAYPMSDQASSVVDALRFEAEKLGVEIVTSFDVRDFKKEGDKFAITSTDGQKYTAKKIVMSTGGKSYPELGSDGKGFEIVKKLGHKVTELKPALVQLKTDKEAVKGMQGVKVDTKIDALYKNKIVAQEEGELLFTDYGISGNAIFYISYITALYDDLVFSVDFMPMYEYDVLLKMLEQRKSNLSYMTTENFLNGIINKKLGQFLIKKSGIEKLSYKVSDLTEIQLKRIVEILKSYKIEILETTGFKNAQVTAGGIYLDEIDMETLESKKVKRLYFTGEIMDVFGDCGGYNLQWAWASGHFVGNEI